MTRRTFLAVLAALIPIRSAQPRAVMLPSGMIVQTMPDGTRRYIGSHITEGGRIRWFDGDVWRTQRLR